MVVVCGNKSVEGTDFSLEMRMSAKWNWTYQRILPRIRPLLELMDHSTEADLYAGSRPLIELLESFRTWDASVSLDKIYALLAFSDALDVPELQPDYSISPALLTRRIVQFAFPEAKLEAHSPDQNATVFEIEGLVLGRVSSSKADSETFYSVKAGESNLPGAIYNPKVLRLFQDDWVIRVPGDDILRKDSCLLLLRGASRPTALRFHEGLWIVDMLATPEPVHDGTKLSSQHANLPPPEYRNRGWSQALESLSSEVEGLMTFKLCWDPFQPLDESKYSRYIPSPNSRETQKDANLEALKDVSANGDKTYFQCHDFAMLWGEIELDPNIEAGTSKRTITIHQAAYKGYYGTVKVLLDANAPVDSQHSELGLTALHLAAMEGHTKIVRTLLDARATIDCLDNHNQTPLCLAIDRNHSQTARMLLMSGADPHPRKFPRNFLLVDAVRKGLVDVTSALLERGVDVNYAINLGPYGAGPTSLHVAAESGNAELVKVLLAADADVNPRITIGATPLHQASLYGHAEVIRLLLHADADINAQDNDGITPLDFALFSGQGFAASVLIQAGGKQHQSVLVDDEDDVKNANNKDCNSQDFINGRKFGIKINFNAEDNPCENQQIAGGLGWNQENFQRWQLKKYVREMGLTEDNEQQLAIEED